jgi:molybdopterin converting factor small subunit
VKILLYGQLADEFGREVEIEALEGCSIGELRQRLCRSRPKAALHIGRSRAIIGNCVVDDGHVTRTSDRVEFLPPVSGG